MGTLKLACRTQCCSVVLHICLMWNLGHTLKATFSSSLFGKTHWNKPKREDVQSHFKVFVFLRPQWWFYRVQTVDHCYERIKTKEIYSSLNTILSYNLGLHIHCKYFSLHVVCYFFKLSKNSCGNAIDAVRYVCNPKNGSFKWQFNYLNILRPYKWIYFSSQ